MESYNHDEKERSTQQSIVLASNDELKKEAIEIIEYTSIVLKKFDGDWGLFFIDWKHQKSLLFQKLSEQNEEMKSKMNELRDIK